MYYIIRVIIVIYQYFDSASRMDGIYLNIFFADPELIQRTQNLLA